MFELIMILYAILSSDFNINQLIVVLIAYWLFREENKYE